MKIYIKKIKFCLSYFNMETNNNMVVLVINLLIFCQVWWHTYFVINRLQDSCLCILRRNFIIDCGAWVVWN